MGKIDIFEEVVRLRKEQIPAALATIVDAKGSTPGKLAQKMIVLAGGKILGTIGGGCVEADVIRSALSVIDTGLPKKMSFVLAGEEAERTGLACGGAIEIMIESLAEAHLFVLGCGHVGLRVAQLAKTCGFRVTVIDDRPDFASRERFPDADEVLCVELDALAGSVRVPSSGYVVVVTRGHKHDYDGLKWALATQARFVGVVGSRSKRIQFMRSLRDEGYAEETLEQVQIPVGLPIGAESPDEIAVAIVGALIAKKRLNKVAP
jgi:xanthine dehydrogenase accessory factor